MRSLHPVAKAKRFARGVSSGSAMRRVFAEAVKAESNENVCHPYRLTHRQTIVFPQRLFAALQSLAKLELGVIWGSVHLGECLFRSGNGENCSISSREAQRLRRAGLPRGCIYD